MSTITAQAFRPTSKPLRIAASGTAQPGAKVVWNDQDYKPGSYRIANLSQVHVAISWGSSAAEAQANAVGPSSSVPVSNQIIIAPLGVEIISLGNNAFISATTDSASANIVIVGGVGL